MKPWRFMDYHSEAGNNLIEAWYLDLPVEAQADFDRTLKTLSITADWKGLKEFKHLGRDGLCEILFKTNGVQYRPAGSFDGERTFVIWVGCQKKQKVFDPPDAFVLALKRRSLYKQGKVNLSERTV